MCPYSHCRQLDNFHLHIIKPWTSSTNTVPPTQWWHRGPESEQCLLELWFFPSSHCAFCPGALEERHSWSGRGSDLAGAHLLWVVAFLDQQWGQKTSKSQLISRYYLFLWPQWTWSRNNELEAFPLTRWALDLTERSGAGFAGQCQVTVRQFCESSEPASSVRIRNRKHICFSAKDKTLQPTIFETVTRVMLDLKMTEANRATPLGTNHSLGLRCD